MKISHKAEIRIAVDSSDGGDIAQYMEEFARILVAFKFCGRNAWLVIQCLVLRGRNLEGLCLPRWFSNWFENCFKCVANEMSAWRSVYEGFAMIEYFNSDVFK
jgi:hypothetical protein